ncbi:MAG: SGNH/GDSL hydrolase family protein [Candidatus Alcyoniella australis]|nr:SGNH/GDSL hydrolase family protein [Candidatus Alcyoniella australis]
MSKLGSPRAARGACRRARRRPLFYLLTVLALLLIVDLALQLVLRELNVAWLDELYQRTGSQQPPYIELRPGAQLEYSGMLGRLEPTSIRINSTGFRDFERPWDGPDQGLRIACVGDSYTMGLGVELEQAFPAQLEKRCREVGRDDARVFNAGVAAYSMFDYPRYLRTAVTRLEPDLIVLQICGNDATPAASARSRLWWAVMRLARFSGLAKGLLFFQSEQQDLEGYGQALDETLAACRTLAPQTLVWVQSFPEQTEGITRELSERHGARIVDLEGFAPQTLPDDPHYAPQSYAELARIVYEQLMQAPSGSQDGAL